MMLRVYNSSERRQDLLEAEALLGATVEEADDDGEEGLSSLTIRLTDGRKIHLSGSGQIGVDSIFLNWDEDDG